MRTGLDGNYEHTLEQVGTIFKVTRERIRQIEAKAKRKLKELLAKENEMIDSEEFLKEKNENKNSHRKRKNTSL